MRRIAFAAVLLAWPVTAAAQDISAEFTGLATTYCEWMMKREHGPTTEIEVSGTLPTIQHEVDGRVGTITAIQFTSNDPAKGFARHYGQCTFEWIRVGQTHVYTNPLLARIFDGRRDLSVMEMAAAGTHLSQEIKTGAVTGTIPEVWMPIATE